VKKTVLILLAFLIASCQKEEVISNMTKTFSIQSVSTGASYSISVAFPENYTPSSQTYATLYVLDGADNFEFVVNQCNDFGKDYSESDMLVVSIGYGHDRSVDYTPTNTSEGDGGAEKFMRFLKEELIPRMENEFAADTLRKSRVILGHSFGGLLAAFAFTNFNEVFGNYLMLSPSIWYDNEIMLRLEQEHRNTNKSAEQLVFMGLGSLEGSGRMLAPFEAFYQRLKNNYPSMILSRHIEPQLDHMGSRNPNIHKGLKFYFQNK
jgi:predicted alpha/beta superfamily hydrolase